MSQNPSSHKIRVYARSAAILVSIAILLRICNFLFSFNTDVDYFNRTPLRVADVALCILIAVWLLSSTLLIPRYSFSTKFKPTAGPATRLTGLACACMSAAAFLFFRENLLFYAEQARLYHMLAIFSLLATIYFAFQFIDNTPPAFNAFAGYIVIFWLGMMLCATYLNLYVAMNSPFKVTFHMALLSMMLHVMEDARLQSGRPFRVAYLAHTLIGILACGMASIPVLIAYALNLYRNVDYLFYASLSLCFLFHLSTRAYDCSRQLAIAAPATPEEIAEDQKKEKQSKEKNKKANKGIKKTEGDNTHVS